MIKFQNPALLPSMCLEHFTVPNKQIGHLWAMIFAFMLLTPAQSFTQVPLKKGYYIAKSDSTRVDGYFDFTPNMFNVINYFKTEKEEGFAELYPGDVWRIVGTEGDLILPTSIKTKDGLSDIFVSRVIDSEISLFEGMINGQEDVFFLNSNTRPELQRINKHAPQTFLQTYLGQKCGPKRKVRHDRYSLMNALTAYAECMGHRFETPPKKRFKLNLALGARAGYYAANPKVKGFFGPQFNNLNGPILGGDIQIGLDRNVYARIGFAYTKSTLSKQKGIKSEYDFRGWPFTFSEPVQFSYSSYEIPVELIWMFNKSKKITPFLGAGLTFVNSTNPVLEKTYTMPDDFKEGFYSFKEEDVMNSIVGEIQNKSNPGKFWQFKAGAIYRLRNKSFLEFGVRYMSRKYRFNYQTQFNNYPISIDIQHWFDLSLAYYLPLTKSKTLTK